MKQVQYGVHHLHLACQHGNKEQLRLICRYLVKTKNLEKLMMMLDKSQGITTVITFHPEGT